MEDLRANEWVHNKSKMLVSISKLDSKSVSLQYNIAIMTHVNVFCFSATVPMTTPSIFTTLPALPHSGAITTSGIVSQFTTPSTISSTSPSKTHLPCLHSINPEDVLKGQPIAYPDSGAVAKLLPDGSFLFTYKQPTILKSISTKAKQDLVIIPLLDSSPVAPPVTISTNPHEYVETQIPDLQITSIIIKKLSGASIQPQNIEGINIIACQPGTIYYLCKQQYSFFIFQ